MTDTSSVARPAVLRRYVVLLLLDLCAKLCGFGATVSIARFYGVETFGNLGFAQQFATYGLWAASCGLDLYAVRHTIATGAPIATIASTVGMLRLGLSAICYSLLLSIALLVPGWSEILPLIALYGLSYFTASLTVLWVAQALSRTDVYGVVGLATQGTYLVCVLIAIRGGFDAWAVPTSLLIAEATAAIGLGLWMLRRVSPLKAPLPLARAMDLLRGALPLGGSRIMRGFALGSDLTLVWLLLGAEANGLYNGAFRLFFFGMSLVTLYFVVLFPILVRCAADSTAALRGELRSSMIRAFSFALPALALALWLARPVLQVIYDPQYAAAERALQIMLVAVVVSLLNGHLRQALIALGYQRADLRNTSLSAGVHVVAKLALIPALGISGAAIGLVIGEFSLVVLSAFTLRAALRETPERSRDSRNSENGGSAA